MPPPLTNCSLGLGLGLECRCCLDVTHGAISSCGRSQGSDKGGGNKQMSIASFFGGGAPKPKKVENKENNIATLLGAKRNQATSAGKNDAGGSGHQMRARQVGYARHLGDPQRSFHTRCNEHGLTFASICTILYQYCTNTVPILYQYCTNTVLILCQYCTLRADKPLSAEVAAEEPAAEAVEATSGKSQVSKRAYVPPTPACRVWCARQLAQRAPCQGTLAPSQGTLSLIQGTLAPHGLVS
eukprot:1177977-Prorocentrum_minimum.AAC.2